MLHPRDVKFEEKEIIRFNTSTFDDRVVVIVPTWNSIKQLPACLASLERQAVLKLELIVSDNNSGDGTEAYVRENHPQFRFIQSRTGMGISAAINRGPRVCRGCGLRGCRVPGLAGAI
ncbi:MAG: glycosyltransferase [Planctomycetota bacterium]